MRSPISQIVPTVSRIVYIGFACVEPTRTHGTDHGAQHIHEGEFIAKFPLIPGHETVGVVAAKGKVGLFPAIV